MTDFTLCFPLREADLPYLKKTLPSVLALNPSEIIIGVDWPVISKKIKALESEKVRLVEVEKTSDWNFHLAKVDYTMINAAKNDRIFYTNADVILNSNVLLGIDEIGKDGVACLSFTKRLKTRTPSDYIRFHYYAKDIQKEPMPFAGIYWIARRAYLELINVEKYKQIYNGVDNFLTDAIAHSSKYKLVCRKEFGCSCLTYESGDHPWRQYQVGMWYGANRYQQYENQNTFWKKMLWLTWRRQHYYLLFGCIFAMNHPEHEGVRIAKTMPLVQWCELGSKHVPMKSVAGTGSQR